MSSEQVTLKDIAKLLNVSPATVSRALQDNPEIGLATRIAVKKLAEELHYQPNTIAQGLRRKKTFTIGVVVPEIVHYFFSSVISGIEEVAYENNYQVILCQSNERFDQEVMNLNTLAKSHVDGILISISKETRDFTHVLSMQEKGIPVVYYDRSPSEGLPVDSVLVDDIGGAYRATAHLINTGCRQLVHFFGPLHVNIHSERLAGFRKAHQDLGVPINEKLVVPADNFRLGYDMAIELCKKGLKFDGIFAVNDLTAVGALKALKSQGFIIPHQVSVVGFGDDTTLSEMVDPTLSSVVQPGFEMGRMAVQLLLERIEGPEAEPARIVKLETALNIRQSSRPIP